MIRVGDDFYLTSSSMHLMPGLPIAHSKDLVNRKLINYAFDRFDLGPEFSFRPNPADNNRHDMYGRGIWAPSFVYNKTTGTYISFLSDSNNQKNKVCKRPQPLVVGVAASL